MSEFDVTLFIDRDIKVRAFEKLLRPDTPQAIMLIRAGEHMGKTWLSLRMQIHCLTPGVALPVVYINFRSPHDLAKISDYLSVLRLARDRFNAPVHFRLLNERINRVTQRSLSPEDASAQARFAQQIAQLFDLDKLQQLAVHSGANWASLRGESLEEKALHLILFCERNGLLDALLVQLGEARPNLDWRKLWSDLQSTPPDALVEALQGDSAGPDHTAQDGAPVADQNLPLPPLGEIERDYVERMLTDAFFDGVAGLIARRGRAIFFFL
jgi:hypothetical protein